MTKIRNYAVLISIAASAGLLTACGNDEPDDVVDTGAATEAPVTQTPPATAPTPSVPETPPAASDASPSSSPETSPANPDPQGSTGTSGVDDMPSPADPSGEDDSTDTLIESGSGDESATDITPEPDSQ